MKRAQKWVWIAAAIAGLSAIGGLYVVFGGLRSGPRDQGAPVTDPGVVHVHGLGVNPANGDVYAATHMGVFHITGPDKARRIADRYQDTMGFTVVGPDHFLASGHPDLREKLPPLLGLLESRDGGETWENKSLVGEADFHALRYAHKSIYGYDSTGSRFMMSRDGIRWDVRSTTVLGDFAVSPNDPNGIVATAPQGIQRSADGGRHWKTIKGPPRAMFVAWDAAGRLWMLDLDGQLYTSPDQSRWEARGRPLGRPEALLATSNRLYAATPEGILVSTDEGRSWDVFFKAGRHVTGPR